MALPTCLNQYHSSCLCLVTLQDLFHYITILLGRPVWLLRSGCGSKLGGTGFKTRPGRIFVIEVVHIQYSKLFKCLEYAVLSLVLHTVKNSIRVGHRPDFLLPFVAILPWFCRERRKAIFTHHLTRHVPVIKTRSTSQCTFLFLSHYVSIFQVALNYAGSFTTRIQRHHQSRHFPVSHRNSCGLLTLTFINF